MAGGMSIQGIVIGLVLALVGFVLYPVYTTAADGLYRIYVERCEIGDSTTLILHTEAGVNYPITADGTSCEITTTAAVTDTVFDEDGTSRSLGTFASGNQPVSGGTWVQPASVLNRFSSINKLLASILPLLLVIGFLSVGFLTARTYGGNVSSAVGTEVILLVIAVVAVYLQPVFIEFVGEANTVTDGRLTVTTRFSTIISLIFSLLPLVFTLGIVAITLRSGLRAFRGGGGRSAASYSM